jgi:hypothetical protein
MWAQPSFGSLRPHIDLASCSTTEQITGALITCWVFLLVGLIYAFAISFYFSASTVIYCLLRRDVDATDLEDVYLDEYEEQTPEPLQPAAPAESGKPPQADAPDEENKGDANSAGDQ